MEPLNRRSFVSLAAAGTAVLAASPIIGITGCSTDWIAVAEKDAPIVVSIATTVVSVVASMTGSSVLTPAAVAIIQEAAAAFQASAEALKDAIAAYQAAKGTGTLSAVISAMNAIEMDAPKIISAIAQAPGGLISIITAAIGTVISLISAIQSLLPSASPAAARAITGNTAAVKPAQRVAVSGVKLPDAQVMKSNFNAVLSVYGYGQLAIK